MADEQTQNAKPTSFRRIGAFLYGAARRVLGTAGQRMKQRWSELRRPNVRRDAPSSTGGSDMSQPAT